MIVQRWHAWVNQPKRSLAWHQNDVSDELQELLEAKGFVNRWSELSDVVYTVTRGRWSGHELAYPIGRRQIITGYVYMYPKYTLRVLFFRRAGKRAGATTTLQSVRNPKKAHKLEAIAREHGIDPELFVTVCEHQRKYWPLLP